MRVLVLYAHPVETSFNAALHGAVVETLKGSGHDVDDCDLYAENFDPRLTREERIGYHEVGPNIEPVRGYVERVRAAEAIVLSFPVWNFGYPAILKGFFDRVFLPGVSFDLTPEGGVKPKLTQIKKVARGLHLWRHAAPRLPRRRPAAQSREARASRAVRPLHHARHLSRLLRHEPRDGSDLRRVPEAREDGDGGVLSEAARLSPPARAQSRNRRARQGGAPARIRARRPTGTRFTLAIRERRTPKTASESRYSSPSKKTSVTIERIPGAPTM